MRIAKFFAPFEKLRWIMMVTSDVRPEVERWTFHACRYAM